MLLFINMHDESTPHSVSALQVAEVKKPEPAAAVPSSEFPPSLHNFVQRCFDDPAAGSNKADLQVCHG